MQPKLTLKLKVAGSTYIAKLICWLTLYIHQSWHYHRWNHSQYCRNTLPHPPG